MSIILFPGSFDPPHLGHEDLIKTASKLSNKVLIGLAVNTSGKKNLLSIDQRYEILCSLCSHLPNCKVVIIQGLVADFVKKEKIDYLLRGLRSPMDFELEAAMRDANYELAGIDTLFLMSKPALRHIRSAIIKEIAFFGGDISRFVPCETLAVIKKLSGNEK